MLKIAMKQSAIDSNCFADDFLAHTNKVVISDNNINARKYLELPHAGSIVPLDFYQKENSVHSVMIEINKRLYMKDKTDTAIKKLNKEFIELIERIM